MSSFGIFATIKCRNPWSPFGIRNQRSAARKAHTSQLPAKTTREFLSRTGEKRVSRHRMGFYEGPEIDHTPVFIFEAPEKDSGFGYKKTKKRI